MDGQPYWGWMAYDYLLTTNSTWRRIRRKTYHYGWTRKPRNGSFFIIY